MVNFFNKNNNLNSQHIQDKGQPLIVDKNQTLDFDALQKARQDLIGEIQVIMQYDEHARSTNNKLAKETWEDIKTEELTHVGELMALINYLDPTQKQYVEKGINEFSERVNKQ